MFSMALDKLSTSFVSMAAGHDDFKIDPSDFIRYLPWACNQLQCPANVNIRVQQQQAYVPQDSTERAKNKSKIKMRSSAVEVVSNADVDNRSFDSISLIDETIVKIIAVYNNDQLIQLRFERNHSYPRILLRIISLIVQFQPHLYMISMNSGVDHSTIYELGRLMNSFRSNITDLTLDGCHVPEANYNLLLDNATIKNLSLARCKINDSAVELIAAKLSHLQPASTCLSILNLSNNIITDVGTRYIANMLRSNRQLSYLNLSGNIITDVGALVILDTLMDFPMTIDEIKASRVRKVEHLKNRSELCLKLLLEMKKTEINKRPTMARKRKTILGQRRRDSKESFYPELDLVFFPKAYALAINLMGPFKDPFDKNNVVKKEGVIYSLGNNTLHYLNLSYTTISLMTLRKIINVMEYQRYQMRRPRGLVYVGVEGNPLPFECEELDVINARIESGLGQRRGSIVMKKKTAAVAKKP